MTFVVLPGRWVIQAGVQAAVVTVDPTIRCLRPRNLDISQALVLHRPRSKNIIIFVLVRIPPRLFRTVY
jgi:hypothetical protein